MEVSKFKNEVYRLASDSSISQQVIEAFIHEFYKHKPISIALSSYPHVVRCSINRPGETFSNVSRCSYNPNIEAIGLMRCNYAKQQVFYAALPSNSNVPASLTAFLETTMEHIKDHDIQKHRLTLSRWTATRKLNVFIFPFSKESIERNGDLKVANDNFNRILRSTFGNKQSEAITYFRDSLEFMSEVFSKGHDKNIYYRISAAFYNVIMNFAQANKTPIDGMIYSSANTLSHGLSIVLKKETIDNKALKCDYVQVYELNRNPKDPKDISFDIISKGIQPNPDGSFNFD